MERSKGVEALLYKEIIPILPLEERFNLGIQVRRAGISVTANISEGYGRYYRGDGIHFYRIARGSIYEIKDHITTCLDLNFIDKDLSPWDDFDRGCQEDSQRLHQIFEKQMTYCTYPLSLTPYP